MHFREEWYMRSLLKIAFVFLSVSEINAFADGNLGDKCSLIRACNSGLVCVYSDEKQTAICQSRSQPRPKKPVQIEIKSSKSSK